MNSIEIIRMRLATDLPDELTEHIHQAAKLSGHDLRLYRRSGVPTDVAIHICHGESDGFSDFTALGECLAEELKQYGLVDRSLWMEVDSSLV